MKLLYTNEKGDLLVDRTLEAAGCRGSQVIKLQNYIPMPEGSTLTSLPYRTALGVDSLGHPAPTREEGWPVAALLPQGYTRTLLPAYETPENCGEKVLPLLGYTAVAMDKGRLVVAAVQTDDEDRWNPEHFNTKDLPLRIKKVESMFPHNRIIEQLAFCSMEYGCFTAQNLFYRRWEGGLPVSRSCNAGCIGCISKQESQVCPSPQGRISFRPKVKEIAEVGYFHLSGKNKDNIISFGQGCEGEPSLEAERIAKAIKVIRENTSAGTINMNTNAGYTPNIRQIVDSGLDTMRVSLFSAIPEHYQSYYRPKSYLLEDVKNSIKYSVDKGVYVSLNLLTFPGYTDREEEIEALLDFIQETGVSKVQLRNLNIDCDYFYDSMDIEPTKSLGIEELIGQIKKAGIKVGNYTMPKSNK